MFGALALGAYLLPEATIRWNEGGHAVRQLGVTLLFLAVPAAVLLGIAVFVPEQFLTLVFSAKLSHRRAGLRPVGAGHDLPLVHRAGDQLPVRHRLPLDRAAPGRRVRRWPSGW